MKSKVIVGGIIAVLLIAVLVISTSSKKEKREEKLLGINYDVKGDISTVVEGDICPVCGGKLYFK